MPKSLSFDKARQAAQVLRSRVVLGDSPAEERKTKRAIPTLAEFSSERYMPFVKGYKKSWDSDDSYLRNHILPKFGSCHLDEIKPEDVIAFHHGMKAQGYPFANADTGKPYVSIFCSWNTARNRAGLADLRLHDLRHSFASFLVNGGRSLYEVQKILGHTQIKTTQRYAHLSQDSLLCAANAASLCMPLPSMGALQSRR